MPIEHTLTQIKRNQVEIELAMDSVKSKGISDRKCIDDFVAQVEKAKRMNGVYIPYVFDRGYYGI